MLGDFASLDVQNTYRGSDAYAINTSFKLAMPGGDITLLTKKTFQDHVVDAAQLQRKSRRL
ncbi:hypothetical protein [Piscirickettsia salmonis]|uniref:hypothetical protein n=1 Tax=Piscirickettsia salmonis TaxID=1238 RepID=UPI0012B91365|nr:hypothetical protein [Piscirickettsia salmonis]